MWDFKRKIKRCHVRAGPPVDPERLRDRGHMGSQFTFPKNSLAQAAIHHPSIVLNNNHHRQFTCSCNKTVLPPKISWTTSPAVTLVLYIKLTQTGMNSPTLSTRPRLSFQTIATTGTRAWKYRHFLAFASFQQQEHVGLERASCARPGSDSEQQDAQTKPPFRTCWR
jgi:hypothetical protein